MARKQPSGATLREFLSKIGSGQTVLHYRKKQLMYVQGDPADAIFYVEKGYVKTERPRYSGSRSGRNMNPVPKRVGR